MESRSQNPNALDGVRVFFAVILCLAVPFASLYGAFASNGADGLSLGIVPLAGALLLLGTARWPSGQRLAATCAAFITTTVYSVALVAWVLQGLADH